MKEKRREKEKKRKREKEKKRETEGKRDRKEERGETKGVGALYAGEQTRLTFLNSRYPTNSRYGKASWTTGTRRRHKWTRHEELSI
jgi:hypothetical protein